MIQKIEKIQRYIKRDYEKEFYVNEFGVATHDECINHCLLFAFGDCKLKHSQRCTQCFQLFDLFDELKIQFRTDFFEQLEQYQDQLVYYLAHQTRKIYLNAQFKASLLELDDDGALIVADYKMKILKKSARETKEEFFGKSGWTLHTILVFQNSNNGNLDIQAYDHWSEDGTQDAWFTANCFDTVFTTMEYKPK